VVKINRVTTSK